MSKEHQKLINVNQIVLEHGMNEGPLRKLLQAHLIPVHEQPYGRGVLRFYDEAEAMALVREHYDLSPPQPDAPAGAVDLSAVTATLAAMTKTLNGIALNQSGTEDAVESINERLTAIDNRATQQMQHLFKELQGIHQQLKSLNADLGVKATA
jgi:hypothetical protein